MFIIECRVSILFEDVVQSHLWIVFYDVCFLILVEPPIV